MGQNKHKANKNFIQKDMWANMIKNIFKMVLAFQERKNRDFCKQMSSSQKRLLFRKMIFRQNMSDSLPL
jgi:hypothetical protein